MILPSAKAWLFSLALLGLGNDAIPPLVVDIPELAPAIFQEHLPHSLRDPANSEARMSVQNWGNDPANAELVQAGRWYSQLAVDDSEATIAAFFLHQVWGGGPNRSTPRNLRYSPWVDLDRDGFITPIDLVLYRIINARLEFSSSWRQLGLDAGVVTTTKEIPFATISESLAEQQNSYAKLLQRAQQTALTPEELAQRQQIERLLKSTGRNQLLQKLLVVWRQAIPYIKSFQRSVVPQTQFIALLPYNEGAMLAQRPTQTLFALLDVMGVEEKVSDTSATWWSEIERQAGGYIAADKLITFQWYMRMLASQVVELDRQWQASEDGEVLRSMQAFDPRTSLVFGIPFSAAEPRGESEAKEDLKGFKTISQINQHTSEEVLVNAVNLHLWNLGAQALLLNPSQLHKSASVESIRLELERLAEAEDEESSRGGRQSRSYDPEAQIDVMSAALAIGRALSPEVMAEFNETVPLLNRYPNSTMSFAWGAILDPRAGSYADEYSALFNRKHVETLDQITQETTIYSSYEALKAEHAKALEKEKLTVQALEEQADDASEEEFTRLEKDKDLAVQERLQTGNLLAAIVENQRLRSFKLLEVQRFYAREKHKLVRADDNPTVNLQRLAEIEVELGIVPEHRSWVAIASDLVKHKTRMSRYDLNGNRQIDVQDLIAAQKLCYLIEGI